MSKRKQIRIVTPMTGEIVGIEQVPDPIFSGKMMGDGAAVIPEDGTITAPVDGVLSTIAPTQHAFGFTTDDGTEVLVHVGLETVGLNGEPFEVIAKQGDKVKAGDPVAKVNLELLKEKGINPITPIVVCGGAEGADIQIQEGNAKAGQDTVVTVTFQDAPAAATEEKKEAAGGEVKKEETKPKKGKKKLNINFDFLQKFGKVLMVVIAVMPAAGLMISLGKLVAMTGAAVPVILTIGAVMENIGWAIINNLNLLFAIAIGGSWAKERAGGAFAAAIAFILINSITGQMFGVTNAMLADPEAVTHTLFGQQIPVDGLLHVFC